MSNKKDYKTVVDEMTAQALEFRAQRNWEPFNKPKTLMLGLFIETAELAEHFQYLEGEELEAHIELFKEDIGEEMADVLYWLLLTADNLDLNLVEVFKDKMKKNALKYPPPKAGQVGEGSVERRRREKMSKNAKKHPRPEDGGEGTGKLTRMHKEKKASSR